MNISATALLEAQQRDGEAADDRPEYVEDALTMPRRVGYREGLPLVEPEGGLDDDTRLGDDVGPLYEHYKRGDSLLRPDAGSFVRRLFEADAVESVADAAEELNSDPETVRKATNLHGVDLPTEGGADDAETVEELELPSGESLPLALLTDPPHRDKLVLAQLLSAGMSVDELARYLSNELDERVTASEIRQAAEDAKLLGGGSDDGVSTPIPPAKKTVTAGEGEPASSPW